MRIIFTDTETTKLYSYTDVARAVDRTPAAVFFRIEAGHVPRPRIKSGKRWFYTQAEFDQIVSGLLELQNQ